MKRVVAKRQKERDYRVFCALFLILMVSIVVVADELWCLESLLVNSTPCFFTNAVSLKASGPDVRRKHSDRARFGDYMA